uniref:Uncharacterized protein n=1 Tax=Anguilla anguilla TaxID=7936 RepID=A0A0E9PQ38_ANGAN
MEVWKVTSTGTIKCTFFWFWAPQMRNFIIIILAYESH